MADVIEKDLTKVTSSNLTPITKPSGTDKRYMRMVDKDGNSVDVEVPAFLRAAIRDELASILGSGGTGGGSVLSVIGGILKTRTDADLASVLGVRKTFMPTRAELAKKVATIVLNNDYSRVGFLFAVGGYGVMAMGVVALRTSGNRTSPTANIIKNVLDSTQCKFIVVKEEESATFTVYVTGSYATNTGGNFLILPMDDATKIGFGSNVEVSSLTAYATLSL